MKPKENDTGNFQITELEHVEIQNPLLALQSFTEDFSLSSVRQLIGTMRDVCITTENVFFGNAHTREDLLHMTRHVVRFFEAGYLYLSSRQQQDDNVIISDFKGLRSYPGPKFLRISQKSIPSTVGFRPYTFPILILSGKWMEKAGFHAGDEVKILLEPKKMLIVNQEWNEDKKVFQRA